MQLSMRDVHRHFSARCRVAFQTFAHKVRDVPRLGSSEFQREPKGIQQRGLNI